MHLPTEAWVAILLVHPPTIAADLQIPAIRQVDLTTDPSPLRITLRMVLGPENIVLNAIQTPPPFRTIPGAIP